MALGRFRRASKNFSSKTLFLAELKPHQGCHMIVPPMPLFDAFLTAIEIDPTIHQRN
jgi:hypothetical protein